MANLIEFYKSTIGKKVVVAVTGIAMILFVVGHVVGNFKAFAGVDPTTGIHALDQYAVFLRELGQDMLGHGTFLWIARIGLLMALVLHVVSIVQLRAINAAARPKGYQVKKRKPQTFAAYLMYWGGLVLLVFIVFHILHLTIGSVHSNFVEGDVYANVYHAFQIPWITGFYVVAMCALGLHLYHGSWSLFQTLGIDNPDLNNHLLLGARVLSVLVVLGFISVPIAVFAGWLPPPAGA